jgi:hypothetical protein
MPLEYDLTQNYDIVGIARDWFVEWSADDALMQLLPMQGLEETKVIWEMRDNFYGLLPLRGIGGTPDIVPLPGVKRFAVDPGYYGGQIPLDEEMINKSRDVGTANKAASVDSLIGEATQQLVVQGFNRVRQTIADLFALGEFKNQNRAGQKTHQYKVDGYKLLTAATAWTNPTAARPIDDLLTHKVLLNLGTGADYGPKSKIMMNQAAANTMMATEQIREKIRGDYGSTEKGVAGLNRILAGYELPQIEIYDKSYGTTPTTATRFLPDNRLIWKAHRDDGMPVGKFYMTRTLVNEKPDGDSPDYNTLISGPSPDMASYMYQLVRHQPMPLAYLVDFGFNAGPAIHYLSSAASVTWA